MTISDHRDLVAALLGVPGAAAAAVEPLGGGPGTLRLQLSSGADEVDVAGRVNRLLRSRFGLAVDADRVRVLDETTTTVAAPVAPSGPLPPAHVTTAVAPPAPVTPVATPEPYAEPAPATPSPAESTPVADQAEREPLVVTTVRGGRLVIDRVQLVSAGLGVSVAVTLRVGDETWVGEAEGAATPGSLHRTVAAATLRAVEACVGEQVRFDVEHVEIATTGEERTALVVVSMLTERATQRLSGASVVREDARQAVIRGVLAAVNRRVEPLLPAGAGEESG